MLQIHRVFEVFDVHRLIIQYLSLQEMRTYGLVSRDTFDVVQSLLRPSNDIELILRRFLPQNRVPYFRRVQRATGTLIGGSTALQLFMRQTYDGSDLDLYVNRLHVDDLVTALELGTNCRKVKASKAILDDDAEELYLKCGVENVQDLMSPTGRVIQVITTHGAPVQSILRYHSSESVLHQTATLADKYSRGYEFHQRFLRLLPVRAGDAGTVPVAVHSWR